MGFAIGDTGFNLVWQSIELYLLFFYTRILGLPIEWAASIFFIGAIVDWLSDPIIGALADRTAALTGRMRGWILVSSPIIGVALVLAFSKPALEGSTLFLWALGTHLLLRISYSAGNIPYAALTARLTHDGREQERLTGLRMQCAALGGLVVASVFATVPGLFASGEASRFLMAAILLAVLLQPFLITTWAAAREIPTQIKTRRQPNPFAQLRQILPVLRRSILLRHVILFILFGGLTTSLLGKSLLFLFDDDLNAPDLAYLATFLPPLALLLVTPFWLILSARKGAISTLKIAAILHAIALMGFAMGVWLNVSLPILLFALGAGVACATGMSVMFWALVPAAAVDVAKSDGDHSGKVFAIATTARKLAQALASPILALGMIISELNFGRPLAYPIIAICAALCATALYFLANSVRISTRAR